ncbi:hypothetical protein LR48_Vigan55s000200 [Vigna angularis]|uniref:Uncharacterized protein n=1 Tax=Phaseolus angularis TaxID=3914 RepID=A0A0L9T4C6_PHAAN|nr:hypothetical protein LR48_Vigan55s000200 [Vigna angularis]
MKAATLSTLHQYQHHSVHEVVWNLPLPRNRLTSTTATEAHNVPSGKVPQPPHLQPSTNQPTHHEPYHNTPQTTTQRQPRPTNAPLTTVTDNHRSLTDNLTEREAREGRLSFGGDSLILQEAEMVGDMKFFESFEQTAGDRTFKVMVARDLEWLHVLRLTAMDVLMAEKMKMVVAASMEFGPERRSCGGGLQVCVWWPTTWLNDGACDEPNGWWWWQPDARVWRRGEIVRWRVRITRVRCA